MERRKKVTEKGWWTSLLRPNLHDNLHCQGDWKFLIHIVKFTNIYTASTIDYSIAQQYLKWINSVQQARQTDPSMALTNHNFRNNL